MPRGRMLEGEEVWREGQVEFLGMLTFPWLFSYN